MNERVEWVRGKDGKLKTFSNPYSTDKAEVVLRANVGNVCVDILCKREAVRLADSQVVAGGLDDLARRAVASLRSASLVRYSE